MLSPVQECLPPEIQIMDRNRRLATCLATDGVYIVRLTDEERNELRKVIDKLAGSSQKVKRAQILLKADVEGPNWPDRRIAEAFNC